MRDEVTREKKQNSYLVAELEKTKKGATRNRGRASQAQDEISECEGQIRVRWMMDGWVRWSEATD